MAVVWIHDTDKILMATYDTVEYGYRPTTTPLEGNIFEEDKYRMIHRNLFSDGPKPVFIKSDTFNGSVYGYVFFYGKYGLGYYIDPYVMRHVEHT